MGPRVEVKTFKRIAIGQRVLWSQIPQIQEKPKDTNKMARIDRRIRSVEDTTKKGLYGLFQNLICGAPCGDWLVGVYVCVCER